MIPESATVARGRAPLATDAYSGTSTAPNWSAAVWVTLCGYVVAPGGSVEAATVNREQVATTPTLYGPADGDVLHSDRIRDAAGVVWEVVGHAARWVSPWGWSAGAVWPLQLVEG